MSHSHLTNAALKVWCICPVSTKRGYPPIPGLKSFDFDVVHRNALISLMWSYPPPSSPSPPPSLSCEVWGKHWVHFNEAIWLVHQDQKWNKPLKLSFLSASKSCLCSRLALYLITVQRNEPGYETGSRLQCKTTMQIELNSEAVRCKTISGVPPPPQQA